MGSCKSVSVVEIDKNAKGLNMNLSVGKPRSHVINSVSSGSIGLLVVYLAQEIVRTV